MIILSIALLVGSYGVALGLSRFMIAAGPRLGLMDLPDERRVHLNAVPRAGGLAVWLTFVMGGLALTLFFPAVLVGGQAGVLSAFIAASALLVAVGVTDDRGGIRPWVKLAGQVAAAVLYWWLKPGSGSSLLGYEVPLVVDLGIWVAWIVLLVNAFNLIDGLDGLCAGLAAISLSGMAVIQMAQGQPGDALLLGLMVASLGGFLRYNRHPARIFLGDAGSMMLGLFVATAATEVVGRKAIGASLLLPLAVAGVPLIDVLLAVWRRSVRKLLSDWRGEGGAVGIFAPDKDHLHHRLLARGWSQLKVTRILHGSAVVLSLVALAPLLIGGRGMVIAAVAGFVIALFGLKHLAGLEFIQSGELVQLALKRREGGRGLKPWYILWDLLVLSLAALTANLMDANFDPGRMESAPTWSFIGIFTATGLIMLLLLRVYRRMWSRARLREFLLVAVGLFLAGMVTAALVQVASGDLTWQVTRISAMASMMAAVGILIPRALPEVLRELAVDSLHRQARVLPGGRCRIVVYGAGELGDLYLDHLTAIPQGHFETVQVVGLLDDKRLLKGRLMRGFEILGTVEDLPRLSAKLGLDGVMVAIRGLDEVKRAKLRAVVEKSGLKLFEWDFVLTGDEVPTESASGEEVA
jgi:UDP-N-acetylmuramyl pentapeptide phosphotransferase/UDP-N-acetylglucosamine-1-phosphate transferase